MLHPHCAARPSACHCQPVDPPQPARRRAARPSFPPSSPCSQGVAQGLVTLLVMSALIFAATNGHPGNVARTVLGKQATPALSRRWTRGSTSPGRCSPRYETWLTARNSQRLRALRGRRGRKQPREMRRWRTCSPCRCTTRRCWRCWRSDHPSPCRRARHAGRDRAGSGSGCGISYPALVLGRVPRVVLGLALIAVFFSLFDSSHRSRSCHPGARH